MNIGQPSAVTDADKAHGGDSRSERQASGGVNDADNLDWERACILRIRGEAQGNAIHDDAVREDAKRAYSELYRRYAQTLFTQILLPRLANESAAEDALSETFRTALEKIDQFEFRGTSIYFWLARIAANKAMDMHRVRSRTSRALANFQTLTDPLYEAEQSPEFERRVDYRGLQDRVQAVLAEINPRYRTAIELRFLDDRPRQECADRLGVKLGTFDVLVLRALRAFRKEWERSGTTSGAPLPGNDEKMVTP